MKLNKKNKLLLGGILLMLVVSYKLAIQNTLALRQEYNTHLNQKELLNNLPQKLSMLSQKEQHIDKQLASLNVGSSSMQNNLLRFLNEQANQNQVKIIDFNAPHLQEVGKNTIETYIFNLEGGFPNILKTIYSLENQSGFGAISHLDYEKKKNYRTKKNFLQATVHLEMVK